MCLQKCLLVFVLELEHWLWPLEQQDQLGQPEAEMAALLLFVQFRPNVTTV